MNYLDPIYSELMPIVSAYLVQEPKRIRLSDIANYQPSVDLFILATKKCHVEEFYSNCYRALYPNPLIESRLPEYYLSYAERLLREVIQRNYGMWLSFDRAWSLMEYLARNLWCFMSSYPNQFTANELYYLESLVIALCEGYSSAYCRIEPIIRPIPEIFLAR